MRRFMTAGAISAIALLWPVCTSAEVTNNDEIAHKIHDSLKSSGRMSGSSFIIKYQDGVACLEGRVSSEEQKALALKLTGEVTEVTEVVDHLHLESKNAANPVVRLLAKTFDKKSGQDEPQGDADGESQPKISSWFRGPSVRAAKAPQPQVEDLVTEADDDASGAESDPVADDGGSVFPEALSASEPTPAARPLIRQAGNLRTVGRGASHTASRAIATESADSSESKGSEPVIQQTSRRCAACEQAAAHSAAAPRVAHTISTKKYRLAASNRQATTSRSQPSQSGRVRMVPMMEMPDGRLVPVKQARRTSPGGQQTASSNRSRAQSMARRQEVIEGPIDMEAAGMAPGPVSGGPVVGGPVSGAPLPSYVPGVAAGVAPAYYDQPHMPNYAWPSYASHPNYAGVTYPRQYSPTAWPYIGPFYPYPQVPLGWRKVTLEWDDGWWFLDFDDTNRSYAY